MSILFSLTLAQEAFPDAGDETLEFYLARSDLVVSGIMLNLRGPTFFEEGGANYYSKFKIKDVLKGNDEFRGKTIRINIVRIVIQEKYTYLDLIKEGEERIVFLRKIPRNQNPSWRTADVWFGVQYPSSTMVRAIKRLAKKEKNIEQ